MPTVSELFQGSISANEIVNNDPNLKPEKSWTSELTAERAFVGGSARATLFFEETKDALYSQVNVAAAGTVATIQNVDRIRTLGVEAAATANDVLVKGFSVNGSITYADSKITQNDKFPASVDKRQPRVPVWRAHALASYTLSSAWSGSLGVRYSSRQYGQLDNSDPNGTAYTGVSNFFTVDARVRYLLTEQVTISLSADNLNGDNYWNFHHYPQRTYAAEIEMNF